MTPAAAAAADRLVVSGPPGSGKSTWVQTHRRPDVPVLDFDLIAYAVGSPIDDHHGADHPDSIAAAAFVAWNAVRNYALAEPIPVWIIHASPSPAALFQYQDAGFALFALEGPKP
jgi:hypothetical protein